MRAYLSLKTEDYKGFLKLHIDKVGGLVIPLPATDTITQNGRLIRVGWDPWRGGCTSTPRMMLRFQANGS
jgi:hypothetical protein